MYEHDEFTIIGLYRVIATQHVSLISRSLIFQSCFEVSRPWIMIRYILRIASIQRLSLFSRHNFKIVLVRLLPCTNNQITIRSSINYPTYVLYWNSLSDFTRLIQISPNWLHRPYTPRFQSFIHTQILSLASIDTWTRPCGKQTG